MEQIKAEGVKFIKVKCKVEHGKSGSKIIPLPFMNDESFCLGYGPVITDKPLKAMNECEVRIMVKDDKNKKVKDELKACKVKQVGEDEDVFKLVADHG